MPFMPSLGRLKIVSTPQARNRSTSNSATVLPIIPPCAASFGKRDGAEKSRFCLTRIQPCMLDDDRYVRFNQARIIRTSRDWFGIGEIIKTNMSRPPRRQHDTIGSSGFAIGKKNRNDHLCVLIGHIQKTRSLMACKFRFMPMAVRWNIPFGDGPACPANRYHVVSFSLPFAFPHFILIQFAGRVYRSARRTGVSGFVRDFARPAQRIYSNEDAGKEGCPIDLADIKSIQRPRLKGARLADIDSHIFIEAGLNGTRRAWIPSVATNQSLPESLLYFSPDAQRSSNSFGSSKTLLERRYDTGK